MINGFILDRGSQGQWIILFEISAVIALLPVVFFTIWGSADRQPWAIPKSKNPLPMSVSATVPISIIVDKKTAERKKTIAAKLSVVKPKQSILEQVDKNEEN